MDKRIKNIIFDFGGIIVDLDKQAAVHAFEALGFEAHAYINDYVQDGVFALMETGEMSPDEFCTYVRKKVGADVKDEEIFRAWNKMLVGIPACRMQTIRNLRTDYRTYMLSNTNAMHWAYSCRELMASTGLEMGDCYDRIFLSLQMHLAKPDERIFRKVLSEAGLKPEETLFVDDSSENCRMAESLGIQVFHSRQPEDWFSLLE